MPMRPSWARGDRFAERFHLHKGGGHSIERAARCTFDPAKS